MVEEELTAIIFNNSSLNYSEAENLSIIILNKLNVTLKEDI
jgi:hypothetical protein